jgi:hypothetical protein
LSPKEKKASEWHDAVTALLPVAEKGGPALKVREDTAAMLLLIVVRARIAPGQVRQPCQLI